MGMQGHHEGPWANLRKGQQLGFARIFCLSAGANITAAPLLEDPSVVVSLCCCSLEVITHFGKICCCCPSATAIGEVEAMAGETLKLYGIASSTCTGRVLVTLFEKGVDDFELKVVNVRKGEGKTPEHKSLQPFGLIPVLQDGALTLFESRAIMRYIADKFEGQGTPLYGKAPAERALVEQWLEVEAQNFNGACKDSLKYAAASPVDEEKLAQSLEKLGKVLDVYETRLATSEFLAGDSVSLADLSHLTTGWKLFDKYKQGSACFEGRPHVKAWWAAISSRPAWKRVLAMI